ncbi:hypothetical protein QBC43DRAFT_222034, partial [Cladorrhinum sp. PSN259]
MEIRISSTAFSLLAGLNLLLANVVMADHTCYDTWGNSDGEQSPCYSPGTTDLSGNTHCCKKGDICLSNGLCLTPGSNYIMTQQGCTDKAWGVGCNQYCDNKRTLQGTNAIPLVACPGSIGANSSPKFCCGPDASSCCQTPSSQLTIPTGTMFQADIVRSTFTVTPTASSTPPDTSFPLKIGLGIGLGLGIPVLLVLCTVAYFLAKPRFRPSGSHSKHHHNRGGKPGFSKPSALGSGGQNHYRNYSTTPSRADKEGRRDSFGRVDTNVGPPSDDGNWDGPQGEQAQWPPNGTSNVAAAIAAWA